MKHDAKAEAAPAHQTALLLKIMELLEKQNSAPQSPDRIRLPVTKGQGQIYLRSEIILLSGDGNYTHVHIERDKQYKELMLCHSFRLLGEGF